jgi:hypothetical protein
MNWQHCNFNHFFNLLQKYGEKRCYLCGCDLEHLVIASHIERITDIDNSIVYTDEEKAARAVDSDNGFWLCANHDKMFAWGIIYFEDWILKIKFYDDEHTNNFIINSIFETIKIQHGYPNKITSIGNVNGGIFQIRQEHFNSNMAKYIRLHAQRVRFY